MIVVIMVFIYWLSNIAVALWIGGFFAYWLLLQLPLTVSADQTTIAALVHGVSLSIGMLDRLRPVVVAACIILLAGVIVSAIIERRRSVSWWALWIWRSGAAVAMVGMALYSSGDIRSRIERVEDKVQTTVATTSPVMVDSASTAVDTPRAGDERISQEPDASQEIHAAFTDFRERFDDWMWIEFLLGAMVLLAGAIKEAAWRRDEDTVRMESGDADGTTDSAERETGSPMDAVS